MLIHVEGLESLAAAEETVSCSFQNQFDGPLYKWVCSRIILWQSALRVYEKSRLWCVVRVCLCGDNTQLADSVVGLRCSETSRDAS